MKSSRSWILSGQGWRSWLVTAACAWPVLSVAQDSVGPVLAPGMPVPDAALSQDSDVVDVTQPELVASTDVRRPSPLVWELDIDAPGSLDDLLETYLDLARFKRESSGTDAARITRSELRRLVISAPDQARSLLEAEGYFGAQISTKVSDEVPGQPVMVTIRVEPGAQTKIAKVQILYEGALDNALAQSDTTALSLVSDIENGWGMQEGEVFSQSAWSSAKNSAMAQLRSRGYPLASWSGTSVTVDATAKQGNVFLIADSGPSFSFGDIRVEGLVRQPASAVLNVAPFQSGQQYNEKDVLDWQERIQKLNLFENVFVSTDFDVNQPDNTPVVVYLKEMPMQAATAGIGVSSDTGPRISGEHLHRNLWGSDWQAKTTLQLGKRESRGQLDLTSHPWPGRHRGLVSGHASRLLDSDDAITSSQRLRVGLLKEGEVRERTHYLEFQHAKVTSKDKLVVANASALSATTQWIWRHVDNQVLPTKGYTSTAEVTLGQTYSALQDQGPFARAYGRITAYKPLPSNWHLTARAEAGQVAARDSVSVPDTLLFRAGGDDSVRGYAYRSLGVEKSGVTTGGRVMATASVEVAHPILARMPSLLGAAFVDVGDAAQRWNDLHPYVGYGVGVRWRSPVGILRLDVARGTESGQFRIHFSVGVSL